MSATALRGFVLASGMGLAACSIDLSGPTPIPRGGVPVPPREPLPPPSPFPTSTLPTAPTDAPTPLDPSPGAAIPQNDPSIAGCGVLAPSRGYGFRIEFSWEDAPSSPLVEQYELVAMKVGATAPIVDTRVWGTTYSLVSCGGFVADPNLDGWEWKVRAVGMDGTKSPWSPAVPFRFLPCRIGDNACSS